MQGDLIACWFRLRGEPAIRDLAAYVTRAWLVACHARTIVAARAKAMSASDERMIASIPLPGHASQSAWAAGVALRSGARGDALASDAQHRRLPKAAGILAESLSRLFRARGYPGPHAQ
jgi:hypothetical protein